MPMRKVKSNFDCWRPLSKSKAVDWDLDRSAENEIGRREKSIILRYFWTKKIRQKDVPAEMLCVMRRPEKGQLTVVTRFSIFVLLHCYYKFTIFHNTRKYCNYEVLQKISTFWGFLDFSKFKSHFSVFPKIFSPDKQNLKKRKIKLSGVFKLLIAEEREICIMYKNSGPSRDWTRTIVV